jgi:hypothetical protein
LGWDEWGVVGVEVPVEFEGYEILMDKVLGDIFLTNQTNHGLNVKRTLWFGIKQFAAK